MSDLSLIPTDELLDEVISRHDHCGFVGSVDRTDEKEFVKRRWKGHAHTVLGLCDDLKHFTLKEYLEDTSYDWETDLNNDDEDEEDWRE